MTRRRAALTNVGGTALNTIVVAVQAIVLMPAYLHVLPTALFGAWLATSDLLNLSQLFDLGLTNVVTQRIGACHASKDEHGVNEWFWSGTATMLAVSVAIVAIGLVFAGFVGPLMKVHGADALLLERCFRICVWAVGLYIAHLALIALARGAQDPGIINAGMVAGSLIGFLVAIVTLAQGAGLWSAAWGVVARLITVVVVDTAYLAVAWNRKLLTYPKVSWPVIRELVAVAPATAVSGAAYLAASQTEGTMVAICLRPELVPILTFTRRAADVAGALLGTITFSTYAGFAHLFGAGDGRRSFTVFREIGSLWISIGIAAAAGYVAVNRSLVGVWVGQADFGGMGLTLAIAAQLIVVGYAQLLYCLYRATGAIVEGSLCQLSEATLRLPLMIGFLYWVGLPGLAIGSILAAGCCGAFTHRAILNRLSANTPTRSNRLTVWTARMGIASIGCGIGFFAFWPHWSLVLVTGSAVSVLGALLLLSVDGLQEPIRDRIAGFVLRARALRYQGGVA